MSSCQSLWTDAKKKRKSWKYDQGKGPKVQKAIDSSVKSDCLSYNTNMNEMATKLCSDELWSVCYTAANLPVICTSNSITLTVETIQHLKLKNNKKTKEDCAANCDG